MKEKGFYIGEVIKFGWEQFKKHIWFFILILLFCLILHGLPFLAVAPYQAKIPSLQHIGSIINWIIGLIVALGMTNISLVCSLNQQPTFADFFKPIGKILSFFVAQLLYSIIVFVGLILLIFPGIIWGLRYSLFPYFIVDKGYGPIKALQASAAATYGSKWNLFGFWFVSFFIVLAGAFVFGIGLFVALPVVWVAHALIYRKLYDQSKEALSPFEKD